MIFFFKFFFKPQNLFEILMCLDILKVAKLNLKHTVLCLRVIALAAIIPHRLFIIQNYVSFIRKFSHLYKHDSDVLFDFPITQKINNITQAC